MLWVAPAGWDSGFQSSLKALAMRLLAEAPSGCPFNDRGSTIMRRFNLFYHSVLIAVGAALLPAPLQQSSEVSREAGQVKPSGLARSSWPKFRGGETNSGSPIIRSGVQSSAWSFATLGKQNFYSPAIGEDGTAYICTDGLYAFDGTTGAKKWEYQNASLYLLDPVIGADGTIYIIGNYKSGTTYSPKPIPLHAYFYLCAIKTDTGKLAWALKLDGLVNSCVPAIDEDNVLYVGTIYGNIYAVDCSTRKLKWTVKTGGALYGSPALAPGGLVCIQSGDSFLYALDRASGHEKWRLKFMDWLSCPAVDRKGRLYMTKSITNEEREIACIDSWNGEFIWKKGIKASGSWPLLGPGEMLFTCGGKQINALDTRTGHIKWTFSTPQKASWPTLSPGGTLYVFLEDGTLLAVESRTGIRKWSRSFDTLVKSPPAFANGVLYFSGMNGIIYAMPEAGGNASTQ